MTDNTVVLIIDIKTGNQILSVINPGIVSLSRYIS